MSALSFKDVRLGWFQNTSCEVCDSTFKPDDKVIACNSNHIFHKRCWKGNCITNACTKTNPIRYSQIDTWQKKQPTCIDCHREFDSYDSVILCDLKHVFHAHCWKGNCPTHQCTQRDNGEFWAIIKIASVPVAAAIVIGLVLTGKLKN